MDNNFIYQNICEVFAFKCGGSPNWSNFGKGEVSIEGLFPTVLRYLV